MLEFNVVNSNLFTGKVRLENESDLYEADWGLRALLLMSDAPEKLKQKCFLAGSEERVGKFIKEFEIPCWVEEISRRVGLVLEDGILPTTSCPSKVLEDKKALLYYNKQQTPELRFLSAIYEAPLADKFREHIDFLWAVASVPPLYTPASLCTRNEEPLPEELEAIEDL